MSLSFCTVGKVGSQNFIIFTQFVGFLCKWDSDVLIDCATYWGDLCRLLPRPIFARNKSQNKLFFFGLVKPNGNVKRPRSYKT